MSPIRLCSKTPFAAQIIVDVLLGIVSSRLGQGLGVRQKQRVDGTEMRGGHWLVLSDFRHEAHSSPTSSVVVWYNAVD